MMLSHKAEVVGHPFGMMNKVRWMKTFSRWMKKGDEQQEGLGFIVHISISQVPRWSFIRVNQ